MKGQHKIHIRLDLQPNHTADFLIRDLKSVLTCNNHGAMAPEERGLISESDHKSPFKVKFSTTSHLS